jgi:hypothetical protein
MAQISMEAGLVACREKLGELVYENVLLRAHNAQLQAEIGQLRAGGAQSSEAPPGGPGPDGAYTAG